VDRAAAPGCRSAEPARILDQLGSGPSGYLGEPTTHAHTIALVYEIAEREPTATAPTAHAYQRFTGRMARNPQSGGMVTESRTTELKWIFRPRQDRPDAVRALTGTTIYSAGPVGPDGEADIVLKDGTRTRATPAEVIAE
jgi:hypothetical protein